MTNVVQTVLGDVDPSVLGRTLTHEHLAMEFTHFYRKPPVKISDKFRNISLSTLGYLRQYPYSSRNNLILNDPQSNEAVIKGLCDYKKYGGGTIVENSTVGLEGNIGFLKQASERSGVHVVAGTGFYIADMQPANYLHSTKEDLYNHMLKDLTEGFNDESTVKAGFIGEMASVWPLREFERKAIVAAGELQAQLGCGVSFHPHRDAAAPAEIVRLYLEAGGSADKAVMSHLDRTFTDKEKLLEFAELGTYCQFDLFGVEVSYYQLNVATEMPSDAQRIAQIQSLTKEGRLDKILMSHDIHTKHRLTEFGGHGYSHIINNILPLMKTKGFTQKDIDTITIENPAKWLTINAK